MQGLAILPTRIFEYDTRLHELRKCGSNVRDRNRIVLTSAMRNDLDCRSQYNQRRLKLVKIAKRKVTEFKRRYHFVVVVVYKLRDRHDVKDAFREGKDTRLARGRGRFWTSVAFVAHVMVALAKVSCRRVFSHFSLFHGIYMLLRSHFRRAIFAFAIRCTRFSSCAKLKFPQCGYKRRSCWHSICIYLLRKKLDINKRRSLPQFI